MIFKLLAFLDLFAVSLVVPALGTHFLNKEIVWIGSVYGIAQFFSQPFFGRISDRFGIKNTILLSLFISASSYFLLSASENVWIIFLARFLAGTFKQTQELSRLAIISKVTVSERPKTIGLFNSIGSAGFIIGPAIGGHIREYYSDQGFYICANITGILFFINFIIVAVFMQPIDTSIKDSNKNYEEANKDTKRGSIFDVVQSMWDLCLMRLFLTMSILMARFVIPILTDRAFGPAKSGYVTSFTALSSTISGSIVALLIPKLLKTMSVAMAEFYVILGCLGTLIMISSTWNASPNWFLFLSNLAMNCFFTQASRILLTELTVQRCPIEMRGYAMGTVTSLTAVSRSLCDVIIASLLQFHDLMPLYVGAVLCAAASAICYSTQAGIKLKKS